MERFFKKVVWKVVEGSRLALKVSLEDEYDDEELDRQQPYIPHLPSRNLHCSAESRRCDSVTEQARKCQWWLATSPTCWMLLQNSIT
jgi:hypothetical protein